MIYLPLSEFAKLPSSLRRFPVSTTPCVICPRVLSEEDYATAERKLRALKADGIIDALCADYGQYALLRKLGFVIHWDVPRGVTDNGDVHFLSDGKVATAACSLTLSMAQIRRLEKPIPLETVVYGRIPLLLSHTCLIRARSGVCACDGATVKMTDRSGEDHPLLTECGTCRNVVYSGKKLYLLDKQADLARLGLWAYRLQFTTEHPNEIDILLRKLHRSAPFDAVACTRGLYPNGLSDRLQ